MNLKATLKESHRRIEHKDMLRKLKEQSQGMADAYLIGYIGATVKTGIGTPTEKLRSIEILIQAYDEVLEESK